MESTEKTAFIVRTFLGERSQDIHLSQLNRVMESGARAADKQLSCFVSTIAEVFCSQLLPVLITTDPNEKFDTLLWCMDAVETYLKFPAEPRLSTQRIKEALEQLYRDCERATKVLNDREFAHLVDFNHPSLFPSEVNQIEKIVSCKRQEWYRTIGYRVDPKQSELDRIKEKISQLEFELTNRKSGNQREEQFTHLIHDLHSYISVRVEKKSKHKIKPLTAQNVKRANKRDSYPFSITIFIANLLETYGINRSEAAIKSSARTKNMP